ncbi:hypothetical protein GW17_00003980 [Ensete ventricosum]|uniref:Uncharacterized protein n=1 Tax=Ensete ventricosum TaxID=4639 RepID=A0A444G961_ENSVE|nr:hypothetical protein B296_00047038 [Ensete ventricosum]RWW31407.1 hypothetical protein GW17_00003980 [Ensete ventricosum]RZS11764.1 hypothetical protein BHM03_00043128 [Ensete ventricosum]
MLFSPLNSEEAKNSNFWSRICLHNMAKLAREATTVRRVLESLFRFFDDNDMWSPDKGLARCVLLEMQVVMENYGMKILPFRLETFRLGVEVNFEVDPFLHLVEDCRLEVSKASSDHQIKVYGSKEDDNASLESLSAITTAGNVSTEAMVSMIINSLGDLPDVITVSFQTALPYYYLVINAILEDDWFPFFQVMPALIAVDDDFTESFENPADSESQLTVKNNLLSVNQILESV